MPRFPASLAVLGIVAACSSPLIPTAERLYGSWTWVTSCGGITGQCLTPSSVGYTQRLELRRDGIADLYRDDTLYLRRRFRLDSRESTGGREVVIQYADIGSNHFGRYLAQAVRFEGLDLILSDGCCDLYDDRYTPTP
jgi:hypothetical protein